ncbi:MAG: magnesium chelatase ATPase subunit I, partial [Acidobacteriota bacterium]
KSRGKVENKRPGQPVIGASTLPVYPFAAIVGQEEMKLALILNVINPTIGGVVLMGQRGTGKSTAVRALAELLPLISVVSGCPYRCDPTGGGDPCSACAVTRSASGKLPHEQTSVAVVDLPLGATEDRVCGTIDIERALREGKKTFQPGLLAKANRGFLYIDEVNLLEDHLVDLLLDVAVTGRNKVERESMSVEHPARFALVGSGNPEEGELRPQLLDRFGLQVEVQTENDLDTRVEVLERREAFDGDPVSFSEGWDKDQQELRKKITRAQQSLGTINLGRSILRKIAELCAQLNIDGHRGELSIARAARALAALEGRKSVTAADVKRVAGMALRHRLRRDPLEETASTERIQQKLDQLFAEDQPETEKGSRGEGGGAINRTASVGPREAGANGSRARRQSATPAGMDVGDALEVRSVPTFEAALQTHPDQRGLPQGHAAAITSRTNSRSGAISNYNSRRGRYAGWTPSGAHDARIAVDATLRAVAADLAKASAQYSPNRAADALPIPFHSLRFKKLRQKSGRLFIFAIDTSGSMALNRIGQAKGAVLNLLRQSYIRRDSVAIIGFRGRSAEVILSPSRSMLRARRALDSLGVGGGTPLPAALASALDIAQRNAQTFGEIVLALFTDGGGNVPLGSAGNSDRAQRRLSIDREVTRLGIELRKAGVPSILIDTQKSFSSADETRALARRLGAQFVRLQSHAKSATR